MARGAAGPGATSAAPDSVCGWACADRPAEAALQGVAGARAPRGPGCGRVGPSSQLEDFAAADAKVDDLLRPAPERVLPLHRDTRHLVTVPSIHDLGVLRPDLHAIAWDELFPVLRDRWVGVEEPDRHVPRQVLDRTQINLPIQILGLHAARTRQIG